MYPDHPDNIEKLHDACDQAMQEAREGFVSGLNMTAPLTDDDLAWWHEVLGDYASDDAGTDLQTLVIALCAIGSPDAQKAAKALIDHMARAYLKHNEDVIIAPVQRRNGL